MKFILIIIAILLFILCIDNSPQEIHKEVQFDWEQIIENYNLVKHLEMIEAKIRMMVHPRQIEISEELVLAIYNESIDCDIVTEDLIISIIFYESSFNQFAVSSVDCVGYMQIHWRIHGLDRYTMLNNISANIQEGCRIIRENYYRFDGDWQMILNAYNGWASYNNTYANRVLNRKQNLRSM